MLFQEQKNVGWMLNLIAKFSALGDAVLTFCVGTMAVGKACMLLSEHLHAVGWEKQEGWVKEELQGAVEIYARQVYSSESDSAPKEDIFDAPQDFLTAMDGI